MNISLEKKKQQKKKNSTGGFAYKIDIKATLHPWTGNHTENTHSQMKPGLALKFQRPSWNCICISPICIANQSDRKISVNEMLQLLYKPCMTTTWLCIVISSIYPESCHWNTLSLCRAGAYQQTGKSHGSPPPPLYQITITQQRISKFYLKDVCWEFNRYVCSKVE